MDICIRADGGSTIGMGHVMRTLVLAKELKKKKNNVFYACRISKYLEDKYKAGIDLIKYNGFNVITIDENKLKEQIIEKVKADCIITDSYDVDEEYFNSLRKRFFISGCIFDTDCVYINKFNVDFFINPDLYAIKDMYKTINCSNILLGADYIILREEFLSKNKQYIVQPNIKNVFLTLGGGNCFNPMSNVLEYIEDLKQFNFYIILGNGFKDKQFIINKYREFTNIKFMSDIKNMSDIMIKCDLAISSCSTTLYELMYLGIPTIGLITAKNQNIMGDYLKKTDIVKVSEINNIRESILNLNFNIRSKMSSKSRKIIDGIGVTRIANNIINLYENKLMIGDK